MIMSYHVAVVGATGTVGNEMLQILSRRGFPVKKVSAVASQGSLGKEVSFGEVDVLKVHDLGNFSFEDVDLVLFAVDSATAKSYVPKALDAGALVIDNSSAYRMEKDVPLIVPEVNPESIKDATIRGIIANPNCVMIQLVTALKPIHDVAPIRRVILSTYQSVSGAGKAAMDELYDQTKGIYSYQSIEPTIFKKRIAFNTIPQIDAMQDDGMTGEEHKIIQETQKVLDSSLKIFVSAVRVPVFVGHGIMVNIECKKPLSPNDAASLLAKAPGVEVLHRYDDESYFTPDDIAGEDEVFVSRIRRDPTVEHGLAMWVVSDNLRKGAALNAVQIAELAVENALL